MAELLGIAEEVARILRNPGSPDRTHHPYIYVLRLSLEHWNELVEFGRKCSQVALASFEMLVGMITRLIEIALRSTVLRSLIEVQTEQTRIAPLIDQVKRGLDNANAIMDELVAFVRGAENSNLRIELMLRLWRAEIDKVDDTLQTAAKAVKEMRKARKADKIYRGVFIVLAIFAAVVCPEVRLPLGIAIFLYWLVTHKSIAAVDESIAQLEIALDIYNRDVQHARRQYAILEQPILERLLAENNRSDTFLTKFLKIIRKITFWFTFQNE